MAGCTTEGAAPIVAQARELLGDLLKAFAASKGAVPETLLARCAALEERCAQDGDGHEPKAAQCRVVLGFDLASQQAAAPPPEREKEQVERAGAATTQQLLLKHARVRHLREVALRPRNRHVQAVNGQKRCAAAEQGVLAAGRHTLFVEDGGRVLSAGRLPGAGARNDVAMLTSHAWPIGTLPRSVRLARVACGANHSLALTTCGMLLSWGRGRGGRLGLGDETDRTLPCAVETDDRGRALPQMVQLSAGCTHSLVLSTTRTVHSFGAEANGRLGHGRGADKGGAGSDNADSQVAPAGAHGDGDGDGSGGVGDDTRRNTGRGCRGAQLRPRRIERVGADDGAPVPRHSDQTAAAPRWREVAAGSAHSLLLSDAGAVYSFGWGFTGALGQGAAQHGAAPADCWVPRRVAMVQRAPGTQGMEQLIRCHATAVAAGGAHSLVLDVTGCVHAFGCNTRGQLGVPDSIKKRLARACTPMLAFTEPRPHIVAIAAGAEHSLCVGADGNLWGFGSGQSQQLALSPRFFSDRDPLKVPCCREPFIVMQCTAPHKIEAIAAGADHSVVMISSPKRAEAGVQGRARREEQLVSFGRGVDGALGQGPEALNAQQGVGKMLLAPLRCEPDYELSLRYQLHAAKALPRDHADA
eukprot:g2864.t1